MQAGFWAHNASVGYRYKEVEGRGKMLVLDELVAPIVRDALEGRAMSRFQSDAEVKRFFESFPEFPRNKRGVVTQQRVIDILDASNPTVIRSYETKISELERSKAVLAEQLAQQAEPRGKFEEQLEPALTFLANLWKLWQTGNINLRRTVLKLAFADRIEYCRIEGPRPPRIALPFKALTDPTDHRVCFGAQERHTIPVSADFTAYQRTREPLKTKGVLVSFDIMLYLKMSRHSARKGGYRGG